MHVNHILAYYQNIADTTRRAFVMLWAERMVAEYKTLTERP
jgi:hypothetical protein